MDWNTGFTSNADSLAWLAVRLSISACDFCAALPNSSIDFAYNFAASLASGAGPFGAADPLNCSRIAASALLMVAASSNTLFGLTAFTAAMLSRYSLRALFICSCFDKAFSLAFPSASDASMPAFCAAARNASCFADSAESLSRFSIIAICFCRFMIVGSSSPAPLARAKSSCE